MAVGIDVGGVNTKIGVLDPDGAVSRLHLEATPRADLVGFLNTRIRSLTRNLQGKSFSVGIGIPGILRPDGEGVSVANNHPHTGPIKTALAQALNSPVSIYGDVPCAAAAEAFGRPNVDRLLYIYVGTGVRVAYVERGEVADFPGEIGLLMAGVLRDTERSDETFESVVGGAALKRAGVQLVCSSPHGVLGRLAQGRSENVTAMMVITAAKAQPPDHDVLSVVERTASALGSAISRCNVMLGPDAIVVGGGLTSLGSLLLDPMRDAAEQQFRADLPRMTRGAQIGWHKAATRSGPSPLSLPPIETSTIEHAGVIGAATLAMLDTFAPASKRLDTGTGQIL